MARAGDKPGPGTYVCTMCGLEVEIKDWNEKLPNCPKCFASTYKP
ncbi:MAG: hypothetical protein C0609_10645 [Deltaproteobacteria bacterium]|nr:MAG: hypothetical protein C0609_10645 [Deltaproteobacteria bacterium]